MGFNSLVFIFILLPFALLVYKYIPKQWHNIFLLILSLFFYAWGSAPALIMILLSVGFNFFAARGIGQHIESGDKRTARIQLIASVAFDVALLAVYKYTGLDMPLGISFYSFSVMSCLFDVYYGKTSAQVEFFDFFLYVMFFPKIISGPIVKWEDFRAQVHNHAVTRDGFLQGFELFLAGFFKKALLADKLGVTLASVLARPQQTVGLAWIGVFVYSFELYLDFSGYSDMAIGLARMFGFSFKKNFDYPYTSESVSVFWRRWHISLGAWFRDYVYIPLGGSRCNRGTQIRNLMIVWVLTGIWHGSTLNYLIWGLYHGSLVLLDKFVIGERLKKAPRRLRILLTDAAVFIGWVFFFRTGIGDAFAHIGRLFGIGAAGFWSRATTFSLTENLILLIIAALCCSPWMKNMHAKLTYKKDGAAMYISVALYVILFVFGVAGILGSTWTSFMYANF